MKWQSQYRVGHIQGHLTLLEFRKYRIGGAWRVQCECGRKAVVRESEIRRGRKSCGCGARRGKWKHGGSYTPEWKIWSGMIARCTNPSQTAYPYYGGRGIKVCDYWIQSFTNFLADVGPRPTPTHTLDRIDTDGDYTPSNVRWATPDEQYANRRFRYMTLRKYQYEAEKTAIYIGRGELLGLLYTVLGLGGEVGELQNKVKKVIRDGGFELTADVRKGLINEAGDAIWYLSQVCHELGVTLEYVARENLAKLRDRKARGTLHGDGDNR